jgi:hypothetical protein
MQYNSLDTIPYKLFVKISETGNVFLLSDMETDIEVLTEIWTKLHDEHLNKNQTTESKKIFKLSKKIDEMTAEYKVVVMACSCLRFEFNNDLFDLITGKGYKLSILNTESYYSDIDQIEREANAYLMKAEDYKTMLPDQKESKDSEYGVDDLMAFYCSVLGFNIGDFNAITYNGFYGFEKQVNSKINAMNLQNTKANGK